MTRRIRYQEIADSLRERVVGSAPGSLLPSEAELSREFGASRVTVRRALDIVRDEGLIASRQGLGWFVATEPVRQRLEHLGTVEGHVAASGRAADRHVIEFAFVAAPESVRSVLGVDQVLRVKRINTADGEPFAVVTVWCPADLGASLSRDQVSSRPFYELLDVELRGATQSIGADSADEEAARLLAVPVGAPLLTCRRVTNSVDGTPILMSEHLYPAHRTEFVVELPHDEPTVTPTGLRLVEHG